MGLGVLLSLGPGWITFCLASGISKRRQALTLFSDIFCTSSMHVFNEAYRFGAFSFEVGQSEVSLKAYNLLDGCLRKFMKYTWS